MNTTIENLIQELQELKKKNIRLEELEAKHKSLEEKLLSQTHNLQERIKEINCLYGISELTEKKDITLEELYQGVVNIIPASWQYPEITCAQLNINDSNYQTDNYIQTEWQQLTDVYVYGLKEGTLTVGYTEKRKTHFEGPFLAEERALIDSISQRLGRITERKRTDDALYQSELKLKKQNMQLQEKNVALREVMSQVMMEKKDLETRVLANIDQEISPLLVKMRQKGSNLDLNYINLMEMSLKNITSSFGTEISKVMPKLTPRENEICNMVKGGLSSKDIAKLLNISFRSVETYRNYIRKKLGITNKKVNLAAYLDSL